MSFAMRPPRREATEGTCARPGCGKTFALDPLALALRKYCSDYCRNRVQHERAAARKKRKSGGAK